MPEAPDEIKELVDKFERNLKAYKSPSYKEEQLKQEFINPFFKALGWDVDNESGAAPQYRDVIFEDSIKVGVGTRAPDYCFTLAGVRKFFVEAKKPSVDIKEMLRPSFQLRRYAWSAKLPLSILTDFEEFAVYESRKRPLKTDRASTERIMYLTYQDYIEKWDDIYNLFSKEAVLKGFFDKFVEGVKKKRGTQEIDDAFLSDLEEWREMLAKNITNRNPEISIEELNYAVQQVIDRLVFLRMCEDRGIEKYGHLLSLLTRSNIYERFCDICRDANDKYNSGLFHFKEERGRETPPDELTLNLKIDDKVFRYILKNLYYPESPYEFSVISPEILGNVYEQFLGKVIRLTAGHRAKVEEKPEVKKAGGVYYTPQFIVDYIVENTVGKLCKGKTPNKISKLRILDPACGSGSFLLGAYTYLLRWHHEYYTKAKDKKRLKDKIYEGKGGDWYLTIKEKKRILLNNIYGVDIDHQAVEVTKLSLLLKVLEGESRDVLEAQQKLFKERALPDLDNNIKCGNSLIGPDFYDQDELDLSGDEIQRINAFDWKDEFKEIMERGGFDAVIGNPPYIRIQAMKEWAPLEVENYKKQYLAASKGNYDIYVVFVERGIQLLNKDGLLGFILPHKFFNAKYGQPLRSLIAEGKYLDKIIHFGDQQVFKRATTYTNLLFLNKIGKKKFKFVKVNDLDKWRSSSDATEGKVSSEKVSDNEWNFIVGEGAELFDKLNEMPMKLENVAHLFVGLQTSADSVYIMELVEEDVFTSNLISRSLGSENVIMENSLLHPLLKGAEISRYDVPNYKYMVLFPYLLNSSEATPITEKQLRNSYEMTYNYLKLNKKSLIKRSKCDSSNWWLYPYPKNLSSFQCPKILCQVLSTRGNFTLDLKGKFYFVGGGTAGGYAIKIKNNEPSELKYLLGILNSKITTFYVSKIASGFRGGFFAFAKSSLRYLPLPNLDSSNKQSLHDKMVKLVERMLQLHKDLQDAKTPNEKKMIQRQIDATDKQIDKLVYELYGLSEDEIKIIESF